MSYIVYEGLILSIFGFGIVDHVNVGLVLVRSLRISKGIGKLLF